MDVTIAVIRTPSTVDSVFHRHQQVRVALLGRFDRFECFTVLGVVSIVEHNTHHTGDTKNGLV
eukprot:CAMPEP_0184988760 /NCGR_PEP_ID=MMETSP1098-20130426/25509_1 /TAXON_ID=89044 /ORGANISM="Spumella elongata, Strain CCAP 955/1" /LENGTH=62 /DNA_ID=CAMNT_0027513597 /DNA_START=74 /DNA_END=258 /DNA_ORIENTATION=-